MIYAGTPIAQFSYRGVYDNLANHSSNRNRRCRPYDVSITLSTIHLPEGYLMTTDEWIIKAKKLQRIQWLLSKGHQPESMGVKLGAGVQKTAYFVDGWVVKRNTGGFVNGSHHKMPKELLRIGLKPCRTYLGTKEWVIQEPCRVFSALPALEQAKREPELHAIIAANEKGKAGKKVFDIHQNNVGLDENGHFVCFDW